MIHQTLSELNTRDAYISLKDSDSSYSMTVLARGELERSIHEKFLNGDLTYISQSVNDSFSSESMAFQGKEVPGKPVIPGSLSALSADAYIEYISQSLNATFTSLPLAFPANKESGRMKIHRTDDGVTTKEVETPNTHTPQDTKTDFLEPGRMEMRRTDDGVTTKEVETLNTHTPQDTKTDFLEPGRMKIHRTDDGVTTKEVETLNTRTPQDTKTDFLEPGRMKIRRTEDGVISKEVETLNTHTPQDTKTDFLEPGRVEMRRTDDGVTTKEVDTPLSGDVYIENVSQSLNASFTSLSMACPANMEPGRMKIHRTDDGVTSKEVETPLSGDTCTEYISQSSNATFTLACPVDKEPQRMKIHRSDDGHPILTLPSRIQKLIPV